MQAWVDHPKDASHSQPGYDTHHSDRGGDWAVKLDETAAPSSVHPTRGLAIAGAFDLLEGHDGVEVLIHGEDGRVRSRLTIRRVDDDLDETEDAALRAEVMRRTPSFARLKAGIGKYLPPPGDFDNEEMPY